MAGWGFEFSDAADKPTQILEANVTTIPTSACTTHYNKVPKQDFIDAGFDNDFSGKTSWG